MAISTQDVVRQIGQAFAEAIRLEPSARRLWVSVHQDTVSLWLLIDALDVEAERRLYPLADATEAVAAGTFVHLHVLNPRHGDVSEMISLVPTDAVEIGLRAAGT